MNTSEAWKKRRGTLLVWGALGVVVLLIVFFAATHKPPEKEPVEPERPLAVRVLDVAPRPMPDVVRLPGRIEPMQEAQLAAERAGRVVEILADKGDAVDAGQVLLRVDSRLWETARRRAEIEARDAERDLKRWVELEKTGAVSATEYESIVRRQESAAIAMEETAVFLAQCEVRSPFAGVVVDRFVEIGDYANEGQAVLRLIRLDEVKLAFEVPERDVGALRAGQQKEFRVAGLAGRAFAGTLAFVSSQAARDSNSFAVEMDVDNADGALKAGMIAQIDLTRRIIEDALVVPLAAVVPRKGEHYVFVVEGGRAVRRRVLIDAMLGHEAVLASGIAAGDRVVVEGHRGLQDGMRVAVAESLAAD
jgi:membrane fusion protein, multidrug efflux system